MRLSNEWYENAVYRLRREMEKKDFDALLLLDPYNLYYLTGFYHQSTERHLGLLIPRDGDPVFYVPKLELEMAQATIIRKVKHYFDYPGPKHGLLWMLDDMKQYKKIGIDKIRDGRDWDIIKSVYPALELTDIVYQIRKIKTPDEIKLMERGSAYTSMMIEETRNGLAMGLSELAVHDYARNKASAAIYEDLGDEVITKSSNQGMAYGTVLYGSKSSFPDTMMELENCPKNGDVITSAYYLSLLNYEFEAAQTFFIGEIKPEYQTVMKILCDAFETAKEMIRPGAVCGDIFKRYTDVLARSECQQLLRYRLGHGKGLEKAEPPWINGGDRSELQAGMVIALTPGLYIKGKAGFRFTDTVVVTESGCKVLNERNTDLDHMVIRN